MSTLHDYFWPNPPKRISKESQVAMKRDMQDKRVFSLDLDDKHRSQVDVWTHHADNLVRTENREWLHIHGGKFVHRWTAVSVVAFLGSWLVSGAHLLEVPLVLLGLFAGLVASFFSWLCISISNTSN